MLHGGGGSGADRARSHCRFAPPLIHFIPDSLTYSVPLFLKQQYDRIVGADWEANYLDGWFGNMTGLKYVFPSAPDGLWYHSYKNGCGLLDDCAYEISSIKARASSVAALIQREMHLVGGDSKKVFLAGFSQGAQMSGYVQLAHLRFALGGVVVMDGFPLPPLCDMPGRGPAAARRNATYYGRDMRWMIWQGAADPIFPGQLTIGTWDGIFAALGAGPTVKIRHVEPGMQHVIVEPEFTQMVRLRRGRRSRSASSPPQP